eukprot:UN23467
MECSKNYNTTQLISTQLISTQKFTTHQIRCVVLCCVFVLCCLIPRLHSICKLPSDTNVRFCEEFVHARARARMSRVTMKINARHSEDFHSSINYYMYLEV